MKEKRGQFSAVEGGWIEFHNNTRVGLVIYLFVQIQIISSVNTP